MKRDLEQLAEATYYYGLKMEQASYAIRRVGIAQAPIFKLIRAAKARRKERKNLMIKSITLGLSYREWQRLKNGY